MSEEKRLSFAGYARAQSSDRQFLRDYIVFTSQIFFYLETERKFTQIDKITLKKIVPENY